MDNCVLWDLDGTIVESEDVTFKNAMFSFASNKINLNFSLKPNDFIGHEAKNIYKLLLKKNKIIDIEKYNLLYDKWYEDAVDYIKNNIKSIKPRENVIEIWKDCFNKGIKQAVVTSSRSDIARAYLKNVGLHKYCELLICIDDVEEAKPSKIPYLKALDELKITNKQCVVVEDSMSGILSATNAGIYTIAWVKDIENQKYFKANFVTKKLDLKLILESFNKI